MRRTNATTLRVDAPSKGLQTRLPPDLQDDGKGQFVVRAENVRAEKAQLKVAPGFERIAPTGETPEGATNLIYQPELTGVDKDLRETPIIGTSDGVYVMRKRARNLSCPVAPTLRFAALADSGSKKPITIDGQAVVPLAKISKMIRSWAPDLIVHAGDLVYKPEQGGVDSGWTPGTDIYDDLVGRYFGWALQGYVGAHEHGPTDHNKFFAAIGNHDYTDASLAQFLAFTRPPGGLTHFTFKRGPVQFFFIDSNGTDTGVTATGTPTNLTAPTDPNEVPADHGSQAYWLKNALAASDCAWRIVVWHHPPYSSSTSYPTGYPVMRWPLKAWGADLLITGHAHIYEKIVQPDGLLHLTVGAGGHSLVDVTSPAYAGSRATYVGYGALLVEASTTNLIARFYSMDGTLRDSVTAAAIHNTANPPANYVGNVANAVSDLRIEPVLYDFFPAPADPSITSADKLPRYEPRAILTTVDGTRRDVTDLCSWTSSNEPQLQMVKRTILLPGLPTVYGLNRRQYLPPDGYAYKDVIVTASYSGLTAEAHVNVYGQCPVKAHDVMVILDASVLRHPGTPEVNLNFERILGMARDIIHTQGTQFPEDSIGFVVFGRAGGPEVLLGPTGTSVAHYPDPLFAVVDNLAPGKPNDPVDLGAAIDAAQGAFSSGPTVPRLIIILTNGVLNHSGDLTAPIQYAVARAKVAKDAGTRILVFSFSGSTFFPPDPSDTAPNDSNSVSSTCVDSRGGYWLAPESVSADYVVSTFQSGYASYRSQYCWVCNPPSNSGATSTGGGGGSRGTPVGTNSL